MFYGIHNDQNITILVIEYLEMAQRVSKVRQNDAMLKAANWIGMFHRLNETKAKQNKLPFLLSYNHEYYTSWVDRTLKFTNEIAKTEYYPWLKNLCTKLENKIDLLWNISPTIIHGEYYPENILFQNNKIYPIDWQSAAVAFGEIDLASLTEGWGDKVEKECKEEYKHVRWPCGTPNSFEEMFLYAKMYWQFRWLGKSPDWTNDEKLTPCFETLYSLGKEIGFL
jgi:thiamine kinase-like enzyme